MKTVSFRGGLLALLLAGSAHAEGEDIESLLSETVVTTPSKSAQTSTAAPATTSVITAEDLRRYGIRSLNEALDYLSLGMATTPSEHAVEIGSRGVLLTGDYGNHVLLLVDGHTLNEPWNGTAYFERGAGIPMELVDHIEVTLGPGSVLYGSQAMLGVINIVTKRAKDYSGVHVLGEAEVSSGASSGHPVSFAGPGTGYRLGAGIGRQMTWFGVPAELTLAVEYYRSHGADFEYAPQVYGESFGSRSPAGTWGGVVKHAYFSEVPTAYGTLSVGNFELSTRVGMYRRGTPYLDSIVDDTGDFDDPRNFERDRFANLELRHHANLSTKVVLRSRLYGDLNEYKWSNVVSAPEECPADLMSGCHRGLIGLGRTLGGESNASVDWLENGTLVSLVGADVKMRDVRTSNDIVDLVSGARSASSDSSARTDVALAAYVEQSASPTRFLTLNAGARLDEDPRFGARVSPRGAVSVVPWKSGRLKLIYSEAFRAPSVYELEYHDPNDVLAAPHLRPETVRSVELSMEQRFRTQHLLVGLFRTWWDDMVSQSIVSDAEVAAAVADGRLTPSATTAYQYRNSARIDNYGWNAGWDGSSLSSTLRYGLNVTEAFTRMNAGDGTSPEPLTVSPRLFGNARVSYDFPGRLPTLSIAAQYQARRLADRALDGGFATAPSAPALVALRSTVTGEMPGISGLSYRLSVTYSFTAAGPYVVGPFLYAADSTTRAALNPIERVTAFAGLEYTFGR